MDSRLPLGAIGLGPDTHKIPVSTSMAEITGAIYCFFIACSSWEVGSKHPVGINIEKAWNLFLLILRFEVLVNLSYKNKQRTPTPNMKCHQTERSTCGRSAGGIYISQRAFTAFLFWIGRNLPDFKSPKQALINAFYNMSANFWFAVQRYYIFFILASTYTKKSPLMSENINGNLNKTHFLLAGS